MLNALAGWKGYAAIALACLVLGIGTGWTVNTWKHEAERAAALDDLIAEQKENYDASVRSEAARLSRQRENEAQTETVIKEVTRYVQGKCEDPVLGPDGARALNRLRQ